MKQFAHRRHDLTDLTDHQWHLIKNHLPRSKGSLVGNEGISRTKGGLNTKLYLSVDARGMPVKFVLSEGGVADCFFDWEWMLLSR